MLSPHVTMYDSCGLLTCMTLAAGDILSPAVMEGGIAIVAVTVLARLVYDLARDRRQSRNGQDGMLQVAQELQALNLRLTRYEERVDSLLLRCQERHPCTPHTP